MIENWRGAYAAATTKLRKGVAFARDHNHPFALLQDLFYLGLPLASQGRYDEALATFTEGLELAVQLGDEIFRNRFLNCRGWVLAECGDLKQAIEFNRRGVGVSEERGDPETIANCKLNLVDLHLVQREFGLARDLLESVHRLAQKPSTSDWLRWRYSQHLFAALGRAGWRPTIPPGPRGSAINASSSRRARARRNTWCAAGGCRARSTCRPLAS